MSNFTCKIAPLSDIEKRWNTLINSHPNNTNWSIWKNDTITNNKNNYRISYYGYLDGEIISEATAIISPLDTTILNSEKLISKDMAYLTAFRTDSKYQNQGYFSKLYKYMEEDLKSRGFTKLSLGVEPQEVKNIQIYFKYGFTNYIKTSTELYPNGETITVNYYYKEINKGE